MKKENCPYLEDCPMFKHFQLYTQEVYIGLYCRGFYNDCKRHELLVSGQEVPSNLLPNGNTLWSLDEPAPEPDQD
jgi:hypothetical protein